MTSENETVKDIAKEIGDAYETWKRSEIAELPTQYLMEWRDRLDVADRRIEAAHQREVAELRKGISELLDALQAIYDEECTSYGTGEVYDKWHKALKGANND